MRLRLMSYLCGIFLLGLLACSCSDDNTPESDQGSSIEQGLLGDQGQSTNDQGASNTDQALSQKEGGTNPKEGGVPTDGTPSKNTGALCSTTNKCDSNTGDECIYFTGTDNPGMCSMKCAPKDSPCPVANPQEQNSSCFAKMKDSEDIFCVYICKKNDKSYKCPNDTDYKCVKATGSAETYVCVPK